MNSAEIISGNENIEGKVMVQLKRALQPALTDVCYRSKKQNETKDELTDFSPSPSFSLLCFLSCSLFWYPKNS